MGRIRNSLQLYIIMGIFSSRNKYDALIVQSNNSVIQHAIRMIQQSADEFDYNKSLLRVSTQNLMTSYCLIVLRAVTSLFNRCLVFPALYLFNALVIILIAILVMSLVK